MKSIPKAVVQNYLTTIFGLLAGLPTIVNGSGIVLSPKWAHILTIVSGIGLVGLGVVSKAFNNHSTPEQIQLAGVEEKKKQSPIPPDQV